MCFAYNIGFEVRLEACVCYISDGARLWPGRALADGEGKKCNWHHSKKTFLWIIISRGCG